MQDVFLQLWRSADRFQISRGPLEPWLFTMARNRALDFLRLKREKQRRREDSDSDIVPSAVVRPDPEGDFDRARRAEKIRALMASLPEAQRQAIELAFFEGLSHSEIAAATGEALGTVKSWIRGGIVTTSGIAWGGKLLMTCEQLAATLRRVRARRAGGRGARGMEQHLARACTHLHSGRRRVARLYRAARARCARRGAARGTARENYGRGEANL